MIEERLASNQTPEITEKSAVAAAHTTWPQTRAILQMIFLVLAVAAALWMLYTLAGVILLVVLSMFFAYLIAPLVELLRRPIMIGGHQRTMPRAAAIASVYLVLLGSLVLGASVLLPQLGRQVAEFGRQVPDYLAHGRDGLQAWRYLIDPDRFPPAVRDTLEKTVARTAETAGTYVNRGLTSLLELLGYLPWLILIPIVAFFLLKDAEAFRQSALLALPGGRLRGRGADLFENINLVLAAYIRAALVACLLVGALCTVGFLIIGVPYALLLGVCAGLLEFIPLVGPLVVAVGAVFVASFYSVGQALIVLLFLGILRIAQDYVIYPRLIGRGVHMHPLAIILAILCGADLAGVAGIFLAIPVVAVLSVVYRHWIEHRGGVGLVAQFLRPAPSAPSVVLIDNSPSTPGGPSATAVRAASPAERTTFAGTR